MTNVEITPEELAYVQARATYHDRTRTSMNDIGSRAALYAKRLRELAKRGDG